MEFAFLLILMLIGHFNPSDAQFPAECSCPDSCICSLPDQTIDCVEQNLKHVPVELNSCSWPGITKVDLSGNKIRFVHEFAFSLLGNITHLYLYDNLIKEVDRSAFIGLQSLEYLYLDGNRLRTLPYAVFWPLNNLKKLLLYGNLLTELPLGIFQSQHLLTQLALYNNRLDVLLTEVFDDLPLLQELYLHANRISDLSGAPFRSLRQLKIMYLNDNRLTRLTRFDFLGLNAVTQLYLSNNQIATIEDDTFKPMLKLQFLFLENNLLSAINLLVFAGPVELLQLRVFNNQIERISDGAFFRLTSLQRLLLYNNRLTDITIQTFVGLASLIELNIYGNRIHSLPNDSFSQSPLLEQLWMYNNELSCLEVAAFRGLGNLELLQLGQNRLSYLPEDIFSYTPALVYLLLYGNEFHSINNRLFKNLQHLVQLSLTSNSIEYIAEGALEGSNSIFYFQWSTVVNLNSLRCDCSTLWLYHWVVSRTIQSSIICTSPPEFQGQDIRSLKPASFGCNAEVLQVSVTPDTPDHVVPRGACLHLLCSSDPRTPVRWSRVDGQELRPVQQSCSAVSPCAEGPRGEGVLVVEGVGEHDEGHYVCTASFQNQTAAQVCRVIVGDPPVLLEEPDEVVLPHPGVLARLHLRFSGHPPPQVTWSHVSLSGEEHVLDQSGPDARYLVSKDGALIIPKTSLSDEGTYRALLQNGAGQLMVEVPLSFLYDTACHGSCFNQGSCVDVSVCMCQQNYAGSYCEIVVTPDETPIPSQEPPFTSPTDNYDFSGLGSGDTTDTTDSRQPPFSTSPTDNYDSSGLGSGDTTDTTDTIDTTERITTYPSTYPDTTDVISTGCSGSECGNTFPPHTSTTPPTTDTEGLIDDEDYTMVTTHPTSGSGSGYSGFTEISGSGSGYSEMSGSGSGKENAPNQVSLLSRRRRRNVVSSKQSRSGHTQEPHPLYHVSVVASFQDIIRDTFQRQTRFGTELEEARTVAKTRRRLSGKTLVRPPLPSTGRPMAAPEGGHVTSKRGVLLEDRGVSEPGTVYLYPEEPLRYPTHLDMHKS